LNEWALTPRFTGNSDSPSEGAVTTDQGGFSHLKL
jgi:hypothetical protein